MKLSKVLLNTTNGAQVYRIGPKLEMLLLLQVALESPSGRAGLLPKDLLITVQGQDVFVRWTKDILQCSVSMMVSRTHEDVAKLIKNSKLELRLTVERGEDLVPNMALLARSLKTSEIVRFHNSSGRRTA